MSSAERQGVEIFPAYVLECARCGSVEPDLGQGECLNCLGTKDEGELLEPAKWGRTVAWWWWSCFPGCLPDDVEAHGPFHTREEAGKDVDEGD